MALYFVFLEDTDRARHYLRLAEDNFLHMWGNFGMFATTSKHELLQEV
jgi:hypothetical protein